MIDINKQIEEENNLVGDNKLVEEDNKLVEENKEFKNNDFEVLNNKPYENNENNDDNNILIGGVDIIYNIDYILPDDEKLINIEKVIKQVNKYIENYNSPQIANYNQAFKQLLQKYSNSKYTIKTVKNKNDSIKMIVVKNDKNNNTDYNKQSIIKEITKPVYFFYNEDCNLYKLKNNISNARKELQYKYEALTSKINISSNDKKNFEIDRQIFIELLEDYYIYTLYHKKINNIITINKTNLLIQEITEFYKDNVELNKPMLNGNLYYVDNSTIDIVNKFNIDRLTQFNTLMIQLSGKDSDKIKKDKILTTELKKYLDKTDIKKINELLKKNILQQTDENIINYIILSLPIV